MDPFTLKLIAVPLIAALTGYGTNYLAVRMLFRPRRPRGPFHGLIPRRRAEIARKLGQTVEQHLISHADLRAVLAEDDTRALIESEIGARVDIFLEERIKSANPMIAMMLNPELQAKLRTLVLDELMQAVPPMTEALMDRLEERVQVQHLVAEKIEAFDLERFEALVLEVAGRELRAIEILGGLIGLLVGLMTDLLFLI